MTILANGQPLRKIVFNGPRSHLDVKQLGGAMSTLPGRGSVVVMVDGEKILIVVENEGVSGESHSAIEER